jgi:hypothetical protein
MAFDARAIGGTAVVWHVLDADNLLTAGSCDRELSGAAVHAAEWDMASGQS